jgi:hypothetical protein
MSQRSKKASSGGSLKQYRRAREDELRRKFAELSPDGVETTDELRLCADRALASVPALEQLYLKDDNLVHVLDAIMQIGFATSVFGKPIPYPPWVLAYLVRVSEECMGKAVAYPSGGNRHVPKEPTCDPDGSMTFYSDYFRRRNSIPTTRHCDGSLGLQRTKRLEPFGTSASGLDAATPVTEDYAEGDNAFTGMIEQVTVELR